MINAENLEELSELIDSKILNDIYIRRLEQYKELYEEEKILGKIREYSIEHDKIVSIVNCLPIQFKDTRNEILQAFEEYKKSENAKKAYFEEMFYKAGVCDGVNLILENL